MTFTGYVHQAQYFASQSGREQMLGESLLVSYCSFHHSEAEEVLIQRLHAYLPYSILTDRPFFPELV